MTIITSKANSVVKNAKKLHQKKYRKSSYLIEGWHLFEEAIQAGAKIEKIFALAEHGEKINGLSSDCLCDRGNFIRFSRFPDASGDCCHCSKGRGAVAGFDLWKISFLGRCAGSWKCGDHDSDGDAAGFSGVIVSSKSADIYSLKTLRSMQGSHFHLPIYRIPVETFVEEAKKNHLPILATTLSQNSKDYRELVRLEDFALVMGNEGQGISPFMAEQADHLVHINMKGQAESLNVAIAAGILMFLFKLK